MRYLQRRGICISVTVEPVQHGCVDLDLEQRCVYSAHLSVCTFVVESYVRLLSLAEIETRGSHEIKRGSVRNPCNRTSVYSFSFRQVGPQILIVSIDTEVCLLRPSISSRYVG